MQYKIYNTTVVWISKCRLITRGIIVCRVQNRRACSHRMHSNETDEDTMLSVTSLRRR